MKLIKKLGALMLILSAFVVAFTFTSCSSSSGVEGSISAVTTATRATVTATFGTNKKLENGDATPYIRQYKKNSSTDKYEYDDVYMDVTFSGKVYTSAKVTFSSLEESTWYQFKLYVTYKSKDKLLDTIEVETKASDEATSISTVEDFVSMIDDPNGDYILANDIDFKEDSETSTFVSQFGSSTSKQFSGTFNGNGHKLLNVDLTSDSAMGVFAYTNGAFITDLTIDTVAGDYSSGRASIDLGAFVGHAVRSVFFNCKVNNVKYDIQGNTTAVINVGGFCGLSEGSTFVNCQVDNLEANFTRSRCKVDFGNFVGQAIKYSNYSIENVKEEYNELIEAAKKAGFDFDINDSSSYFDSNINEEIKDQKILAYDCISKGDLNATLYYLSKTDNSDAFTHAGGFVGDVSTNNLVYDCVGAGSFEIDRSESESNDNRFTVAIGGFFGINYTGAIKLVECLSDTAINVYAGSNPTKDSELSEDQIEEKLIELGKNQLCFTKDITKSNDKKETSKEYAYIGVFGGMVSQYAAKIEKCVAVDNIFNIYATQVRLLTDLEAKDVLENSDIDINLLDEGTEWIDDSYNYGTTYVRHTSYVTIADEEVELTSETFNEGTYYTKTSEKYIKATTYNENEAYYKITLTDYVYDSTTDFSNESIYALDNNDYVLQSELNLKYVIRVQYLFHSNPIAFVDESEGSKIQSFINASNVTSEFGNVVYEYINSIGD